MNDDRQRYFAACHAMQTGVQLDLTRNGDTKAAADHKHLRVGVNVCMCDHAALIELLVEKGVITSEEYVKAIADQMEKEVDRYHGHLELGPDVTLR